YGDGALGQDFLDVGSPVAMASFPIFGAAPRRETEATKRRDFVNPKEDDFESESRAKAGGSRRSREAGRGGIGHRNGRKPRHGGRRHDASSCKGASFRRVFPGGEEHPGAPRGRRFSVRAAGRSNGRSAGV